MALAAAAGLTLLAGCGSGAGNARRSQPSAVERPVQDSRLSAGQTVDPSKVAQALDGVGLRIVFHDGPIPPHFARAVYGTARNAHGTSVNFGFFLTGGTNAQNYYEPALRKLVPGATAEGSTVGESYVSVTSAGSAGGSGPKAEEEFTVADTLQVRVAALAHQAFEEE